MNIFLRVVLRNAFVVSVGISIFSVPFILGQRSDSSGSPGKMEARAAEVDCSEAGKTSPSPSNFDYVNNVAGCLPAPSIRAVPFQVREPLRNGLNVPVKKRWIEVPPGTSVVLSQRMDGTWEPKVPEGTRLWKEFYLETEKGIELIERRLTIKVPSESHPFDGFANSGWHFVSAWEEPQGAIVSSGNPWKAMEAPVSRNLRNRDRSSGRALPVQRRSGPMMVTFSGHEKSDYMFPGTTACYVCHGGATAGFRGPENSPTLAFGIHPDNLTADSLQRLVSEGVVTLMATEQLDNMPAARVVDQTHQKFWNILRNNCLSCHNPDPLAAGHNTAFAIDPHDFLSRVELLKVLSQAHASRHQDRLPLVTPGNPERSELVLRLRGENRRRMPPAEGGVPYVDSEFVTIAEEWVRSFSRAENGE